MENPKLSLEMDILQIEEKLEDIQNDVNQIFLKGINEELTPKKMSNDIKGKLKEAKLLKKELAIKVEELLAFNFKANSKKEETTVELKIANMQNLAVNHAEDSKKDIAISSETVEEENIFELAKKVKEDFENKSFVAEYLKSNYSEFKDLTVEEIEPLISNDEADIGLSTIDGVHKVRVNLGIKYPNTQNFVNTKFMIQI